METVRELLSAARHRPVEFLFHFQQLVEEVCVWRDGRQAGWERAVGETAWPIISGVLEHFLSIYSHSECLTWQSVEMVTCG